MSALKSVLNSDITIAIDIQLWTKVCEQALKSMLYKKHSKLSPVTTVAIIINQTLFFGCSGRSADQINITTSGIKYVRIFCHSVRKDYYFNSNKNVHIYSIKTK